VSVLNSLPHGVDVDAVDVLQDVVLEDVDRDGRNAEAKDGTGIFKIYRIDAGEWSAIGGEGLVDSFALSGLESMNTSRSLVARGCACTAIA